MSAPFRTGFGYDIHRLVEGRRLVLGGVEIPSTIGLEGHSDADVLAHAIADAILGALALPDIGHFFPNTDPTIAGMDSREIIRRAVAEAHARGFRVGNVDAALIAERPRLAAHIPAMRHALAQCLGCTPEDVGVKATTNERIGDLGKGLGIAAMASVLLWRAPD